MGTSKVGGTPDLIHVRRWRRRETGTGTQSQTGKDVVVRDGPEGGTVADDVPGETSISFGPEDLIVVSHKLFVKVLLFL